MDLVKLAEKYQREREENFKTVDPETCSHSMVYNKQGDDMHCHFCDKFMYDASKD